ncbi:hypothetical protein ml_438 [Mollivirus sibericum]|uniref:hypothetical protein n=1 Tax=Mollivirus sibericum TaxID=1678078 RepID=UPI0006B2E105|nr:hypothetical protein ml_438 [Mollivirus sibericum]ALD62240.1 hypothetical protein ml_438 [Mollivirus sibericum]
MSATSDAEAFALLFPHLAEGVRSINCSQHGCVLRNEATAEQRRRTWPNIRRMLHKRGYDVSGLAETWEERDKDPASFYGTRKRLAFKKVGCFAFCVLKRDKTVPVLPWLRSDNDDDINREQRHSVPSAPAMAIVFLTDENNTGIGTMESACLEALGMASHALYEGHLGDEARNAALEEDQKREEARLDGSQSAEDVEEQDSDSIDFRTRHASLLFDPSAGLCRILTFSRQGPNNYVPHHASCSLFEAHAYAAFGYDPTESKHTPPHYTISAEEREALLRDTCLKDRDLKQHSLVDPVVVYYGLRPRDAMLYYKVSPNNDAVLEARIMPEPSPFSPQVDLVELVRRDKTGKGNSHQGKAKSPTNPQTP